MPATLRSLMWPALTVAACAIAALLGWETLHGGIRAHHLLADPSLPAISNAWGLLTVPGLAWLAAYTVARRAREVPGTARAALLAWAGALLVGAALAAAFVAGVSALSNAIALGALAAGLVVRTYRAEIGYGFTLGMMAAVGPVLPLLVITVAAVLSALAHLLVWPGVAWLWRKAQR